MEFTLWDILRNLLLAARWTILLSLVAFATGGIAGLGVLLLRVAKRPWLRRAGRALYRRLPGHAAADAALPGVLRAAAPRLSHRGLVGGRRRG